MSVFQTTIIDAMAHPAKEEGMSTYKYDPDKHHQSNLLEKMHHSRHQRIKADVIRTLGRIQRKPLHESALNSECSPYVRNRLIQLEYERRGLLVPEELDL